MKYVLVLIAAAIGLAGCNKVRTDISRISSPGTISESVYLTHDHTGHPVIVWTEKDDDNLMLVYAISNDDGKSFSGQVRVPLHGKIATHAEGMPKVAFKKNGTVIVAYERKAPTEQNKYAGSVFYRTSVDKGKTWSNERYLHADTIPGRSRSYFDIETLADGEVGASWLDIKLDTITGGRSVRFAKTNSANDFTNEILVDSAACECCRVDVYTDVTGNVNIAYRDLMQGPMGKPIRDMMIASSATSGSEFTTPSRISVDNWNIDGCPHTGPALCSTKGNLLALWYTEGNGTGIFYAHRESEKNGFTPKQKLSSFGHHPQASSNENSFAIVWEENFNQGEASITRIQCQVNDGQKVQKATISPEDFNAYHPVITQTNTGFLVAFIMEQGAEAGVYMKHL